MLNISWSSPDFLYGPDGIRSASTRSAVAWPNAVFKGAPFLFALLQLGFFLVIIPVFVRAAPPPDAAPRLFFRYNLDTIRHALE